MRRTPTAQRTIFHLPPPNAVTFVFRARDAIEISIPDDSMWRMRSHWHYTQLDARYLQVVHGKLLVSSGSRDTIGGGFTQTMNEYSEPYKFELDERIQWEPRYQYAEHFKPIPQALTVRLIANEVLHRNSCSVVLDYKIFPELNSTPYWLKALFRLLAHFPSTEEMLLRRLLAMQRQLTLHAHDYHERHGHIPFSKMGVWWDTPRWAWRLELLSMLWISYAVGAACYWIGRLAFGMSALYPEYTAVEGGKTEEAGIPSVR